MTRDELLTLLKGLDGSDPEEEHVQADYALLEFIDDPEITAAFTALTRWYA